MQRMLLWGGLVGLFVFAQTVNAEDKESPFARWEKSISAFEAQDKTTLPPKGGVLFVGSSSIRLWKVGQAFPKHQTINRGFGGSQIADSVHFADRIVIKHQPRTIVFYAGDNDIARNKTPDQVAKDFREFTKLIHGSLPRTKIIFVAIKPSIARWKLAETIQKANANIRAQCEKNEQLVFLDVWQPMLGEDGKPRPEHFAKDGLHLNETGYKLWNKLLLPHLPTPSVE